MDVDLSHPQMYISCLTCFFILLTVTLPSNNAVHRIPMPPLDLADLDAVVLSARETVTNQLSAAEAALEDGGGQVPGSPAWFLAASARIKVVAKNISVIALVAEEATRTLATRHHLTKEQINLALPTLMIRGTILGDHCPVEVDFPCQPRRYRAFNGYCNNVQNPRWGNANTRYLRLLPADYGDGVSSLRTTVTGVALPSAREVSLTIHADINRPHSHATTMMATWLQFINHDLAHTSQAVGARGRRLTCCLPMKAHLHPECAPIEVPGDDPVYSVHNVTCLDYVRSCMGPRTGCLLGPREQVNQVTSFLDASVIYGSSKEESEDLRTFSQGLLRTQALSGTKGLLLSDDNYLDCKGGGRRRCFKSGDIRVNENIGLALMHTLWVREHNRVASALKSLNPHWNDETLFQEARRIVAAEIQHIHYNELLPLLLGKESMDQLGLAVRASGHSTDYDIDTNPGTANALAASVLPLVISLFPTELYIYENHGQRLVGRQRFSDTSYAPFELYEKGKLDGYLIGLTHQQMQSADSAVSIELSAHLFGDKSGVGVDAVAYAIQQGRDHGIPSYIKWRELCGLPAVGTWDDLKDVMSIESITKLKTVYSRIEDVDLFSGGLSEIPVKGAVVGTTMGCLIGRQFQALRSGDRYWYENDLPPSAFTNEQLKEIRKSSLARIICDNSDSVQQVQAEVLMKPDQFLNSVMDCEMIQSMNLQKWKLNSRFVVANDVLEESLSRARREVAERKTNEHQAFLNHHGVASDKSPIGVHLGFVRPKREAISISNTSLVLQFASRGFVNSFLQGRLKDLESNVYTPKSVAELLKVLPNIDVSDFVDIAHSFQCDEQTLPCDHTSRFRTFTGLCNNLENPTFGKSFKVFQRLLPPTYDDNLSEPRTKSITGSPLPSARLVSISIHSDTSQPHTRYTLMTMQFGQFVDHDLTHTPVHTGFQGAILDCSRCDSRTKIHPECLPIIVPTTDPYFPANGTDGAAKCFSLVRSLPGQLTMGPREQINQITPFIDASHVYGSDVCDSRKLRSFSKGRLNITRNPSGGKELLPQTNLNKECKARSGLCFEAGDKRTSEQIGLASMHTMFMREHNRIVGRLSAINTHWTDEQLYQNGRRILSAINQHIIFSEFLPRVLGWTAVHDYGLELVHEGFYDGYDPTCNAAIFNEFATAAFRFGHSLIKPFIQRMNSLFHQSSTDRIHLRHQFFNPDDLYKTGMIDELMRGLATTTMETLDQFITTEVTNHLFEDSKVPFSGMDLVALNLQRGREHGIATYNQMRVFCNLSRATTFEDLSSETPSGTIHKLKAIYKHVDDIDLFTGGLAETAVPGGLVGPTFACIIGLQFHQLRKCDRFWYETSNPLLRFTADQLMEIRSATLSKIVCQNSDLIDNIQLQIFDQPDTFSNPRVSCRSIPEVNLNLWAERPTCTTESQTIPVGEAKRTSPCVMCTCTSEGLLCKSIKISNCFELVSSFTAEKILSDQVCKVQCAFVFRTSPNVDQEGNDILSISS